MRNLATAYLPNISFFSAIYSEDKVIISGDEIFPKQTFRNRCVILNANGTQNLIVPVEKPKGHETMTCDVKVSYAEDWVTNHVRSIESAYRRTPYYEYYIDSLQRIYHTKFEFLSELNLQLLNFLVDKIGLSCQVEYVASDAPLDRSARELADPKKQNEYSGKAYLQTFTERYGFVPNLSILDLLMNEGPNSISILSSRI
ncbi:MAG: WbqC family protein [Crocinitomicaceae bacterium]|nr:WbqC family protein [Crocinitomicaceae bacterium]MBK8925380.1 WbqC family protein [Crocinitomicaceae bacterium]